MNYQTFAPPETLAPFIKYFWALERDAGDDSENTFAALPDGCPGAVMVASDKEALYMDRDRKLPNIFLYGQTIRPASFSSSRKFNVIGICFQPHALRSVFGMDAGELTGSCLDLSLVGKKNRLPEQLSNASTIDDQIRILSFFLFDQHQNNKRLPDAVTKYAIEQLVRTGGAMSLKELQRKAGLSERSLERKFRESVGISPKLFSRIVKFQESMNMFRKSDYDKLADIAYEHDYADQSHFIRVFKEFTGFSPREFKNQSNEVAKNFPQIKK